MIVTDRPIGSPPPSAYIDIDRPSEALKSQLDQNQISLDQLRSAAGGDHHIRVDQLSALSDKLAALSPSKEGINALPGAGNAEKSKALYDAFLAEAQRNAQPYALQPMLTRTPGVAVGMRAEMGTEARVAAPRPDPETKETLPPLESTGQHRTIGKGKTAQQVDLYVRRSTPVEHAADRLAALPTAKGQVSVSSYFAAIASNQRHERSVPKGVDGTTWALARSSTMEGVTQADARHFLVTGELLDQCDQDGKVIASGKERLAKLNHEARKDGNGAAVNTFSYLTMMRRSALAADREQLNAQLKTSGGEDRAEIEQALADNRALDQAMGTELRGLNLQAAAARVAISANLLGAGTAVKKEIELEKQKAKPDDKKIAQLEAKRTQSLNAAAKLASAEYKSHSGHDAAAAGRIAAYSQIELGHDQIDQMHDKAIPLSNALPETLGDAASAKNGAPGATRLVNEMRQANPKADREQAQLELEARLAGTVGDFHREHLLQGGYFDRGAAGAAPSARPPALLDHRRDYLAARAAQYTTDGKRLAICGAPEKVAPKDALVAGQLSAERATIMSEFEVGLGTAISNKHQVGALEGQVSKLEADLKVAQAEENRAYSATSAEHAQKEYAHSDNTPLVDVRTDPEKRRGTERVEDHGTKQIGNQAQYESAKTQRQQLEQNLAAAKASLAALKPLEKRDAEDGAMIRNAVAALPRDAKLDPAPKTDHQAYQEIRTQLGQASTAGAKYLNGAAHALPKGQEGSRTAIDIAHARLDLAGALTASTESDLRVADWSAGSSVNQAQHKAADKLIAQADSTRRALPAGSGARIGLAQRLVDDRSQLAESQADYAPQQARDQLSHAESIAKSDLPATLKPAADARIGSAAVGSLFRHQAHFDEVLKHGKHLPGVDDALYSQGSRLLGGSGTKTPEAEAARARLKQLDHDLAQVTPLFTAAGKQMVSGQAYADAEQRDLGRADIAAGQATVSSVITGPIFLGSGGAVDIKEDMAAAGEAGQKDGRTTARRQTDALVRGQKDLGAAWSAAGDSGQRLEMLNSLRILARPGNDTLAPAAFTQSNGLVASLIPPDRRGPEAGAFFKAAIREGGVPAMRALTGPYAGLGPAGQSLSNPNLPAMLPHHQEMIRNQENVNNRTIESGRLIVPVTHVLEGALAVVTIGGVSGGAGAGVAGGGEALEAGAVADAVASGGLTGFRAAHPLLHAFGNNLAIGAGTAMVGDGINYTFGKDNGFSNGAQLLIGFAPLGGVGARMSAERKMIGAVEEGAAKKSIGWSAIRDALGSKQLLSHAEFYGPQFALAGGQVAINSVVVPLLADRLGARDEGSQKALGLGLSALLFTFGAPRGGSKTEGLSKALVETMGHGTPAERAGMQREVDAQLSRISEGSKLPDASRIAEVRRDLYQRFEAGDPAAAPAGSQVERRQLIDGMVEAVRIQRSGELSLNEAGIKPNQDPSRGQVDRAIDSSAQRLFESRGGEAGGASLLDAKRDAAQYYSKRFAGENRTSAQNWAGDRGLAAELTEGFSRPGVNEAPAVITSAKQQQQVEAILSEELGLAREAIDGNGPPLDQGSPSRWSRTAERLRTEAGLTAEGAESVLRASQHALVEQGVVRDLAAAQIAAGDKPLNQQQVADRASQVARRAGVPDAAAQELGVQAAKKSSILESVGILKPVSKLSIGEHRANFMAVHPAAKDLATLSDAQFKAAFGDGPYPSQLADLAAQPGFAAFAAKDPARAQSLFEARAFGYSAKALIQFERNANPTLSAADLLTRSADIIKSWTPTRRQVGEFTVLERPANSPNHVAGVRFQPGTAIDHNGAFHQRVEIPGRLFGTRDAISEHGSPAIFDLHSNGTGQLIGPNGPIQNLDQVAVFSAHGSRGGFDAGKGMDLPAVSHTIASELKRINATRSPGQEITTVVFDSCNMGNRRFALFGETPGQRMQRLLDAEMGGRKITVLVSDKPGSLYGTYVAPNVLNNEKVPATFIPADQQKAPRRLERTDLVMIGAAAGVAGIDGGAYYVLSTRREAEEKSKAQRPPAQQSATPARPGMR